MTVNHLISTSLIVSVLINFKKKCQHIANWIRWVYENSKIYLLINYLIKGTKINLRGSFAGRITNIDSPGLDPAIFKNSRLVRKIAQTYPILNHNVTVYLNRSLILEYGRKVKKGLHLSPLKTSSMVVTCAILTNIVLLLRMRRELSFLGWVMRSMLLLIAFGGLFCEIDWSSLKNTSIVLKMVKKCAGFAER